MSELREAAQALVDCLQHVHQHPDYLSVWTSNQLHNGPYKGPQYFAELNRLIAALEGEDP